MQQFVYTEYPWHIQGAIIGLLHDYAAELWNYKTNSLITLLIRKSPDPRVKLWLRLRLVAD